VRGLCVPWSLGAGARQAPVQGFGAALRQLPYGGGGEYVCVRVYIINGGGGFTDPATRRRLFATRRWRTCSGWRDSTGWGRSRSSSPPLREGLGPAPQHMGVGPSEVHHGMVDGNGLDSGATRCTRDPEVYHDADQDHEDGEEEDE